MKVIINKTSGKFLYAYNDSAMIIGYLTGYKVLDRVKVGFPDESLEKVKYLLESNVIDYDIINEFDEVIFNKYFDNNDYLNILKISKDGDNHKKLSLKINRLIAKMSINNLELIIKYLEEIKNKE